LFVDVGVKVIFKIVVRRATLRGRMVVDHDDGRADAEGENEA
jgi:hypothetical protein